LDWWLFVGLVVLFVVGVVVWETKQTGSSKEFTLSGWVGGWMSDF
jgi:hypothetical protein